MVKKILNYFKLCSNGFFLQIYASYITHSELLIELQDQEINFMSLNLEKLFFFGKIIIRCFMISD